MQYTINQSEKYIQLYINIEPKPYKIYVEKRQWSYKNAKWTPWCGKLANRTKIFFNENKHAAFPAIRGQWLRSHREQSRVDSDPDVNFYDNFSAFSPLDLNGIIINAIVRGKKQTDRTRPKIFFDLSIKWPGIPVC